MLMHRSSEVAALEPLAVKGHVTGPVSFGFTLTDEARKPIFYHQAIMEAVTQTLRMKIRWQVKRLQSVNPRVVIFIDEPYLGAMGSALIRLSPEEILEHIGALIGEIRESGAVSGIHCCANTDWGLLLRSGVDIISFDAYSYGDKFLLFQDALPPFLEKGGLLCWGIVPTSAEVEQEDSQSLLRRMEPYLQKLETRGFPREMILRSSLISPSCGMGTLPLDTARTVMGLTIEVSSTLAAGLGRRPAHD
jgi:methionine synthase II (cobalamin-independent)